MCVHWNIISCVNDDEKLSKVYQNLFAHINIAICWRWQNNQQSCCPIGCKALHDRYACVLCSPYILNKVHTKRVTWCMWRCVREHVLWSALEVWKKVNLLGYMLSDKCHGTVTPLKVAPLFGREMKGTYFILE